MRLLLTLPTFNVLILFAKVVHFVLPLHLVLLSVIGAVGGLRQHNYLRLKLIITFAFGKNLMLNENLILHRPGFGVIAHYKDIRLLYHDINVITPFVLDY